MNDLRKNVNILTPENVTIEYESANVGSRFIAFFIDNLIMQVSKVVIIGIVILILILNNILNTTIFEDFGNSLNTEDLLMYVSFVIIAFFVLDLFYFIIIETIMGGQTPGKKAAGLKVVSTTGEPINFNMTFIRNILRIVDVLPSGYFIGGMFILYNKKSQRIGDLMAKTMVIKVNQDRKFSKKLDDVISELENNNDNQDIIQETTEKIEEKYFNDLDENAPKSSITEEEFRILDEYLKTRTDFADRLTYDIKLFNYFHRRTNAEITRNFLYKDIDTFIKNLHSYNKQFYNK